MKRAFAVAALLALTGCSPAADAPDQVGICWMQAGPVPAEAKPRFVLLSRGDANLETCAMHLELTRISKHRSNIFGAFQGQYVFVDREAIASSESLTGQRFSLFTPGQRSDVDAQIVDLLKSSAKPASTGAPRIAGAKAAP
jgi:hypothetical protein